MFNVANQWDMFEPQLKQLPVEKKGQVVGLLKEIEKRQRYNQFKTYFTQDGTLNDRKYYAKQWEFMMMGKEAMQRAMVAGNQVGKSLTCGYEVTVHALGIYPPGWDGYRPQEAPVIWVCATGPEALRQGAQTLLFGRSFDKDNPEFGTGLLPRDKIGEVTKRQATNDLIQKVEIHHASGRMSQIHFKTFKMTREAFESATIHFVWLDETAPYFIYTEALTRLVKYAGRIVLSFTPLKGLTDTVTKFIPGGRFPKTPTRCGWVSKKESRWVSTVTWDDVVHLNEKEKEALYLSYPPHERECRRNGTPSIGSGRVYPIEESKIKVPTRKIPEHWPRAYGMDAAWGDTAAVMGAIDPNTNIKYIYDVYKVQEENPIYHSAQIKARLGGDWIIGACDPALTRSKNPKDGQTLLNMYQKYGLNLVLAKNDVDIGITAIWQELLFGTLVVMEHCYQWFDEFNTYSFGKNGKIGEGQDDHLMDATKYLILTGFQFARLAPELDDDDEDDEIDRTYANRLSRRDGVTGY